MITALFSLLLTAADAAPQPTANPLQQQYELIKSLRAQELAELQAASKARQMQHELQVAEAEHSIRSLGQPSARAAESAGPGLEDYQLIGVVQGEGSSQVLLRLHQQLIRLTIGVTDASGLYAEVTGTAVRLSKAGKHRLLPLPRGW